jgi:hypothetical protein
MGCQLGGIFVYQFLVGCSCVAVGIAFGIGFGFGNFVMMMRVWVIPFRSGTGMRLHGYWIVLYIGF